MEKTFKITALDGLHARPCTLLVSAATPFKSEATLRYKDRSANLKSIMSVMSQAVPTGAVITISAVGEDEVALMERVVDIFISQGLGEEC